MEFGLTVNLKTDMATAEQIVTEALKAEGFGILTEIDVKATLKQKIDVDFRPYKILGACNPPLAHRALETVPVVGLLLPCNVTVSYIDDNTTQISMVDPLGMMGFLDNSELEPVAKEARERLERVHKKLEEHNANL